MGFIKGLVKLLMSLIVLVALAIGIIAFIARSSDGPIGLIAGGELVSGRWHEGDEPDWAAVRNVSTVEFQLMSPPRSRTTWIIEHEGRIFIPCGYMTSTWGRMWKQWPIEAEHDGRAVLRINGVRYHRELVRIKDGPLLEPLTRELTRKYDVPASPEAVTSGSLWIFELEPRKVSTGE